MQLFEKIFSEEKSVLILGFGKEGRSTYKFLTKNFPGCKTGIADQNTAIADEKINAPLHLGKGYLKAINDYDLVIKSPGIKLNGIRENAKEKITSQTDLFLRTFSRQTIGVTGTKGKSTTASLIYHLLENTGHKAILMGNIGLPAFDFLRQIRRNDWIVYELSAHQLEFVHASPHVAVLLNLFPEHLDYFKDFESYKGAKLNIFRFQQTGDIAFCGKTSAKIVENCETIFDMEKNFGNSVHPQQLLQLSGLKGQHNLDNILLAFRVMQSLGTPVSQLPAALTGFRALPHRLEYVGSFGRIDFFNDSISTVPQSTMAAVNSIPQTDALILGGFDRGLDYEELVRFLLETGIKHFFFLGKAGERMRALFSSHQNNKQLHPVEDLNTVFYELKKLSDVKCCLLSPAAASYDQFHNFEHRGDIFKKLATGYRKKQ